MSNKKTLKSYKKTIPGRIPRNIFIGMLVVVVLVLSTLIIKCSTDKHRYTLKKAGITILATNTSYDDKGADPFSVPEGWKLVIITVKITNNNHNNFYFAPVVQTYLTSIDGTKFYMSPTDLSDPLPAGLILSQSTISGMLSYLVPKNMQNIKLQFEP
ncbi:MAG: DUF4352 domain-containing protein [Candidatus Saccharibacteria bacterium]